MTFAVGSQAAPGSELWTFEPHHVTATLGMSSSPLRDHTEAERDREKVCVAFRKLQPPS